MTTDALATWVLIISFAVLVTLNVPVAFCMGIATLLGVIVAGDLPSFLIVAHKMATGIDSFALLAIPFFILSGLFMERGGIARRLIEFANVIVGRFRGGLALVNIFLNSSTVCSCWANKSLIIYLDDNKPTFGIFRTNIFFLTFVFKNPNIVEQKEDGQVVISTKYFREDGMLPKNVSVEDVKKANKLAFEDFKNALDEYAKTNVLKESSVTFDSKTILSTTRYRIFVF
jgi:hypothetical protein